MIRDDRLALIDEIEITPEMIEVGVGALSPFADFLDLTPNEQVREGVAEVYRAMRIKELARQVRSSPDPSPS